MLQLRLYPLRHFSAGHRGRLQKLRMKTTRLVWLMTNWCTRNPKCFTCNFRSQYQRTRKELFPVLSRIQNIGYELGENSRTADWYRANHRTPWVATNELGVGETRDAFTTRVIR